jgi:hypothetical protein
LQAAKDSFRKQGIEIVGLSYDSREILGDFAKRKGIDFTLLADSDSSSLANLGLVNPEGKAMTEGVAFPGIIYVNSEGTVEETFFEDSYANRPTAGSVLSAVVPEPEVSQTAPPNRDYRLSQTGGEGIAGSRWELAVEFPLPDKAHLYAPGDHSYQAVTLTMSEHPYFDFGSVKYPLSETLYLEAIGEKLPVFSHRTRLTVPVSVTQSEQTKKLQAPETVTLNGVLKYQICTDKTCYMPVEEAVSWEVTVKPLDRVRAQPKHQE